MFRVGAILIYNSLVKLMQP